MGTTTLPMILQLIMTDMISWDLLLNGLFALACQRFVCCFPARQNGMGASLRCWTLADGHWNSKSLCSSHVCATLVTTLVTCRDKYTGVNDVYGQALAALPLPGETSTAILLVTCCHKRRAASAVRPDGGSRGASHAHCEKHLLRTASTKARNTIADQHDDSVRLQSH